MDPPSNPAPPQDDPSAKRKRAGRKYTSRACEECRRRRAKCDGMRPSCSRCLDRGSRCQYSTAEDGRQPAPKSYVVMLRNRIELLERVLRNHGIDAEASVAELMVEAELFNQQTDSNHAVDDLCVTFDGALTIDESLNFDQDGEVRYFGPTSGRLLFQSSTTTSPEEDTPPTDASYTGGSGVTPDTPDLISPHCATKYHECPFEPDAPPISEELQAHLINLYFDWDQPWLQVVNEQLFRESLASGGRYCSPLLLNCILAVGSRYCDRIEVRTDPNDSNTAGKMFICVAERLINNDLRWPKITTIQSLTIMGMYYIATGSDAAGWLQQGMANRLAIDMGFNMDPAVLTGTVSLPAIEIELRRQIYWALYCHDKLSACYTGRVCTLLDSQGAVNKPDLECVSGVQLPSANGQLRAANQKTVTQLQRSMIDLCRIIEKILRSLWSPKPLLHCHQRAAFFDTALLELKTWYYDLPSELKVDRPSGPSRFPHAFTLSMVYHQAVILLCCPFVSSNTQSTSPKNGDTVQQSPQPNDKQSPNSRYAKALSSCSNSIRVMCCIAQRYRQTFGSFKLSPITATHCTLSTALMLIELCCAAKPVAKHSPTDDGPHRLPPHAAVALCFQVLRELSTSWNIAKRIGRNLERVYIERYGSEHLAFMPKEGEENGQVLLEEPKFTTAGDFTIPNLEMFDDILNARPFLTEDPLQVGVEIPVEFNQPPNFSRPGIPAMALHSSGDTQNFPNQDEAFVNSHGYAFSLDSLPSDYNMFDTLNQMYLEDSW
ncbi:uncharacterized protein N7484_010381 [Penicillium longicatenatum]|uniref:uncharacterized protein n=1 Tax=Penicillium longicatenatum TaxID=1561947 RepID=UPI002547E4E5|nr:uncharacterized protein N7484_010381 [Penicillium longicatenatum]KAJ5630281.1 hypothetical protein N7484_010381 [Penicillium longicatenatum]